MSGGKKAKKNPFQHFNMLHERGVECNMTSGLKRLWKQTFYFPTSEGKMRKTVMTLFTSETFVVVWSRCWSRGDLLSWLSKINTYTPHKLISSLHLVW